MKTKPMRKRVEPVFKSREEFQAVLNATLDEVSKLEGAQPNYPVWGKIRRHLERMKETSSDGRYPSGEDQDACLPGTIAMRELEPATDLQIYDLTQNLHKLQYYFQLQLQRPSLWSRWRKKD